MLREQYDKIVTCGRLRRDSKHPWSQRGAV